MAGRKRLKNFNGGECSDEFRNAFVHAGSIAISCEVCGRTHFYEGPASWESGEYAELIRGMKSNPDRYIAHDTDSIHWAMIFGKQVVIDCPCQYAGMIEKLFWAERFDMMGYFTAKAKRLKSAADRIADEAEATSAAIEGT